MDGEVEGPHRLLNPEALSSPVGFTHAVVAAPGRTVYLGGQTAHDADDRLQGVTTAEQFEAAAANVVTALDAAGARPDHLVSVQIYVTDVAQYRSSLDAIGGAWHRHFGRHYPAVALFGVPRLFDADAKVELVCIAVIPDLSGRGHQ